MNVYEEGRGLYLNLTNRCPVSCRFCVKKEWDYVFKDEDLRIAGPEPTADELIAELEPRLKPPGRWHEAVFCGFGECVYRLDVMSSVGLHLKLHHPKLRLRLNTVGLGDIIWGRDITPELARYLDEVSVSLNTAEPAQWLELHRPAEKFRKEGFAATRLFTERCVAAGIKTRVTAVDLPEVDLDALAAYAKKIGANFFVRPTL